MNDEELRHYKALQPVFREKMGEWHVDHKIPVSAFNFETPNDIDFKKCWKLSNLQPLWAAHNLSKSDKVEKPIQPSLLLEDK